VSIHTHTPYWQVVQHIVHSPSRPSHPLVMHITVRQHAIMIQQHQGSVLSGFYLAMHLLIGAQQNSLSQNRAEHKHQRYQAQHGHNVPVQLAISVERTRREALTSCLTQQPKRYKEMQQIRQHKANIPHHLMRCPLTTHHIHEELIEAAGENVQQGDTHNAKHFLRLHDVRRVGQVHH